MLLIVVTLLLNTNHGEVHTGASTATAAAKMCINRPPVIEDDSLTFYIGTGYNRKLRVFNPEDDQLTYTDNFPYFTIGENSGMINYYAKAIHNGSYTVKFTVEDDSGCLNSYTEKSIPVRILVPPTHTGGIGGGGGGGGGGQMVPQTSIELSDESLKVNIKEGQQLTKTVKIVNDGDKQVSVEIINPLSGIADFAITTFYLDPEEIKDLTLTFNPYLDLVPDVYTGKILFAARSDEGEENKELVITLEVESEEKVYDTSVEIKEDQIQSEDDLEAVISVFKIKETDSNEAQLHYIILNENGQEVYSSSEIIQITEQVSFNKIFQNLNLPEGSYTLVAKIIDSGSVSTSTEKFKVGAKRQSVQPHNIVGKAFDTFDTNSILLTILVIAVVAAIAIISRYIPKKPKIEPKKADKPKAKPKQKVKHNEKKVHRRLISKEEVKRKMGALKEGYKRGFISKESYEQTMKKLKKLL